ncbi:hypothetical protein [Propionispira raffinosivorans]|uniref:hypothetical protein n=1 Tax=Propionispira raffinosivorans TaxID=86959 RepID=UPI00036C07DE|nr:hypothetical protein [Propionispira raffinosivorans]
MMMKNVFDSLAATKEQEILVGLDLRKYSSEYFHASEKILTYQDKIKNVLPLDLQETLEQLDDEYNCMMLSGMDVYYRQGFSDAVRLIMETMSWSPRRS